VIYGGLRVAEVVYFPLKPIYLVPLHILLLQSSSPRPERGCQYYKEDGGRTEDYPL